MPLASISNDQFNEGLHQTDKLVMIDFWATWCGPCKALAPILDELSEEYDGQVAMYKANIEEEPALAMAHRVMSVPSLVFYRNGEKVKTVSGGKSRQEVVDLIEELKS